MAKNDKAKVEVEPTVTIEAVDPAADVITTDAESAVVPVEDEVGVLNVAEPVVTTPKTKAELFAEIEDEVAKLGNIGHFYYVELGRAKILELLQQIKPML